MASGRRQIIYIAFLVTGNLIGAGILGLPINTGLAGFAPSVISLIVVCGAMLFTAFVIGEEACGARQDTFNLPSLYEKYLGSWGKWIATSANLLILYCLLTAYISGCALILSNIFANIIPQKLTMILAAAIMTGITIGGMELVKRCNALLMFLMWASFGLIVFLAEKEIVLGRYLHSNWADLPATVPIIVTAFHFHNIIPSICRDMKWDIKAVFKAMLAGMIIGFLMNFIWIQVGIGALPLDGDISIMNSFSKNEPATIPMAAMLGSKLFTASAIAFAIIAIATSYFANGTGLMGFLEDLFVNSLKIGRNKILIIAAAFVPPVAVALSYPEIFLKAINIAGGFGIVTLFGILPSIISLKKARSPGRKGFALAMLGLFILFLLFEAAQEFGCFYIPSGTES
ncbi:MAG: hypothetical protein A2X49_12490, partial [Lentisphaerae bacterium GWF2_52_8]